MDEYQKDLSVGALFKTGNRRPITQAYSKMNPRSSLDSNQNIQEQFNVGKQQKWYLRWWTVIVWLATLGPFGLPFLWKSKDFNLFWKWFLTLMIIALTVMLSWGTWKIIKLTIDQFKSLGLI